MNFGSIGSIRLTCVYVDEDDVHSTKNQQILLEPNTGTTTIVRKRRRYTKRASAVNM